MRGTCTREAAWIQRAFREQHLIAHWNRKLAREGGCQNLTAHEHICMFFLFCFVFLVRPDMQQGSSFGRRPRETSVRRSAPWRAQNLSGTEADPLPGPGTLVIYPLKLLIYDH